MTHYSPQTLKKIGKYLWITEIFVWLFYISKGYISAKIQDDAGDAVNEVKIFCFDWTILKNYPIPY